MTEQPVMAFADLLRQLRQEAGLTQEELAEAARLSPRSVSDLERGVHRSAHKDSALLLADALGLAEPTHGLFVAAARGRLPAARVIATGQEASLTTTLREQPTLAAATVTRTLPRDSVTFTGRDDELARLLATATSGGADGRVLGIHAIDGMAGIGKTTLAVRAAHRLADSFPDGQFFLPLHAHTPGQRAVDPADALACLLVTAGIGAQQIPSGLEARAARWRDHVAGKKILLLLDDASGHDQIRPLLPGGASSLVLITSRRRLAALPDAVQVSLDTLSPCDGATLLAALAARASLQPGDAAVGEIARLCGYLPLAIGMLASQLRSHPARTAETLAVQLAVARDRLALMHAENLSVGAAFDLSYADLDADQQRMFRRLGLVPGPSIDSYAAAALDDCDLAVASRCLDELYDQHLITEPAPGRYELHDLLREHARALAAADDAAESLQAAGRLLDYYLHGASSAGRHFTPVASFFGRPLPGRPPRELPSLSALAQAAEWLDAERANLYAVVDYAADHDFPRHASVIPGAISAYLWARGHWDQSAALHHKALTAARRAGDRFGEAVAVAELGTLQLATGDYPAAATLLNEAVAIFGDVDDGPGQAYAHSQLGFLHVLTGDYRAAARSLEQAMVLARAAGDRAAEAVALSNRSLLQQLTGDHAGAAISLQRCLTLFRELDSVFGQALALNGLGVVQQELGDHQAATISQQESFALYSELGELLGQAYALNDLGIVQKETGDYPAAAASHERALALFGELGNRVGQAEALNRLGELATRTGATERASRLHAEALAISRDIGAVPEEARSLEGLGRSYLQAGEPGNAALHLQQALAKYQRMGAPGASRVRATLRQHGIDVGES